MSFCSDDAYFVLRGQGEIGAGVAEMLCGSSGVIETLDFLVYSVVGVAAALIVVYVVIKAVRFINENVKR